MQKKCPGLQKYSVEIVKLYSSKKESTVKDNFVITFTIKDAINNYNYYFFTL